MSVSRKPYETADGYACILPYSNRNWRDFYEFTGRTEFLDDTRFTTLADRALNIDVLYKVVEEEAKKKCTLEWVTFCDAVSIPCMPVLSLEDLHSDEHVRAVELFLSAVHPTEGRYRTMRSPIRFGSHPFEIRRHAPNLGEHTAEVLEELARASSQKAGENAL